MSARRRPQHHSWLTRNTSKLLNWTVGGLGIGMTLNTVDVLLFDRPS